MTMTLNKYLVAPGIRREFEAVKAQARAAALGAWAAGPDVQLPNTTADNSGGVVQQDDDTDAYYTAPVAYVKQKNVNTTEFVDASDAGTIFVQIESNLATIASMTTVFFAPFEYPAALTEVSLSGIGAPDGDFILGAQEVAVDATDASGGDALNRAESNAALKLMIDKFATIEFIAKKAFENGADPIRYNIGDNGTARLEKEYEGNTTSYIGSFAAASTVITDPVDADGDPMPKAEFDAALVVLRNNISTLYDAVIQFLNDAELVAS